MVGQGMRTRLKGLLNQICWLGGCLLITYVPWGPSDMVNTPDYSQSVIEIEIMSACLARRVERKGLWTFRQVLTLYSHSHPLAPSGLYSSTKASNWS